MTQRVSSNITIFLKLFLPTAWIVFFALFTLSIFIVDEVSLPFLTSPVFKYPFLAAFLLFFLLIYKTIMQLKRLELGEENYIVSNYFKTVRFQYRDIDSIDTASLGRFQLVTFNLSGPGSFGKRMYFLVSKSLWNLCLTEFPEIKRVIESKLKSSAS
jgi:hypothetical protein